VFEEDESGDQEKQELQQGEEQPYEQEQEHIRRKEN
jgi:hypothetical protein